MLRGLIYYNTGEPGLLNDLRAFRSQGRLANTSQAYLWPVRFWLGWVARKGKV